MGARQVHAAGGKGRTTLPSNVPKSPILSGATAAGASMSETTHAALSETRNVSSRSRRRRRSGGALAFVALLGIVGASCSSEETAASIIGISPEAFTQIIEGDEDFLSPVEERRVEAWIGYVQGDQVVRIGNGGVVPWGDFEIEFRVTPFPPTQFDVNAELVITGARGVPTEARVEAWYDMIFMTHGQPIAAVETVGPGHYRLPLDLFMFGPWVVKASMQSDQAADDLPPLIIYVWPKV